MLDRIGLDDDAKKRFVASLWNDYYNGTAREKSLAARLLATACRAWRYRSEERQAR